MCEHGLEIHEVRVTGGPDVSYNPPAGCYFEPVRTVGQGCRRTGCIFFRVRHGGASAMTWRAIFAFVLVVMIAASIGMAVAAAERSPGWFLHPGARVFLTQTLLALVIYAGAIIVIVANRGEEWDVELRNAAIFGSIAGIVELINVALESSATTSNTG